MIYPANDVPLDKPDKHLDNNFRRAWQDGYFSPSVEQTIRAWFTPANDTLLT